MDGIGSAPINTGNAVVKANPKNLSRMWTTFPHTYLLASGEAVGLPENVKGNSEVGHLNIGSGRIVTQTLPRINKSMESGLFMKNDTLWKAFMHAVKYRSNIHLIGCVSDGSVHSHINHFIKTLEFFAMNNFANNIYIHAFTDGRDTAPGSASKYLSELDLAIARNKIGQIATLSGRSMGMDRSGRWEKTKIAFDLIFRGVGSKVATWKEALENSYKQNRDDEYLIPSIIPGSGKLPIVTENDVVIYMNFRADRALQLTYAISQPDFKHFDTHGFKNLFFASMIEYRKGIPKNVIFPKEYLNLPIGKVISASGLRQLRISETEKFPHVTYFFNGGMSVKYQGEDRIEVPSPAVATYDLKPEMSAFEIMKILEYRITTDMYEFIVLNLANGDMVGHTGNLNASIKAVSIVDECVGRLTTKFVSRGGYVVLTADHGNVEEIVNLQTGQIDTEHSINPVPFIIAGNNLPPLSLPYGTLKDISPTILNLLGISIPTEMTGKSLISNFFQN